MRSREEIQTETDNIDDEGTPYIIIELLLDIRDQNSALAHIMSCQ